MTVDFLQEFDSRDPLEANELLFDWICSQQTELLSQLRRDRSVLKFHSLNPNNPDRLQPQFTGPTNTAYLLSDPADVRQALSIWSMVPHSYSGKFILAIDDEQTHAEKRRTLVHKLQDSTIGEHIDAAVALSARNTGLSDDLSVNSVGEHKAVVSTFDVHTFARHAALHFVVSYFGLPEENVFTPANASESTRLNTLESAGADAFNEYIWKIHARHFVQQRPDVTRAIATIKKQVKEGFVRAADNTVLGRFRSDPGAFADSHGNLDFSSIVANVIGCIQGLVDNVTISACNAINQLMLEALKPESKRHFSLQNLRACAAQSDLNALRNLYYKAHQIDAPAPFLPRFANRYLKIEYARDSAHDPAQKFNLDKVHVACATGYGARSFSETTDSVIDIRMGYGRHDCIGRYLGDELALRIVQCLLCMDSMGQGTLKSVKLEKQWGWIVRDCKLQFESPEGMAKAAGAGDKIHTSGKPQPQTLYVSAGVAQPGAVGNGLVTSLLVQNLETLKALTNAEITALSPAVLRELSDDQLRSLTDSQISSLSYDQANSMAQVVRKRSLKLAASQRSALDKRLSYFAVKAMTCHAKARPYAHSLWCADDATQTVLDYTTWPGLVDRGYTARQLPPATEDTIRSLPYDAAYVSSSMHGDVTALFKYDDDLVSPSRSSLLFPMFAQWFTDSFLSTDPIDRRKNTSSHQIDMCQIYAKREQDTAILRSFRGGKLRSEYINDNEFPPRLFDKDGNVKPEFSQMPQVLSGSVFKELARIDDDLNRRQNYLVTGLAQGNSTFGKVALNTLFLREHNRVCDQLRVAHTGWNDERIFQTARMIVILLEIKIVISEYINHISASSDSGKRLFRFDHEFAENEPWYRTNHIALEFNLLYRWHSLVPKTVAIGRQNMMLKQTFSNNLPLIEHGLDGVLLAASVQRVNCPALHSTPDELLRAEYAALKMARDYRVRSFNEYRHEFGLNPLTGFGQLQTSESVREELAKLYQNNIDSMDLLVGLYAEQADEDQVFGPLMTAMVAHDAFTQALTNPLLSRNVFGEKTIGSTGMKILKQTESLNDVWQRNRDTRTLHQAKDQPITMDY